MLGYSGQSLLENPSVIAIATTLEKTPAQVVIRWAVQRGTSVVPKSATASRIAQNFDVQAWELSSEDMHTLNNIEPQVRMLSARPFLNPNGPYRTSEELFDEE
jgi:diketogulonate reductase-like aldo/keto reductase